jgi:hypothetical protein
MSYIGRDTAYRVLDLLQRRKGFDEWWDSIDADVQEDIIQELAEVDTP